MLYLDDLPLLQQGQITTPDVIAHPVFIEHNTNQPMKLKEIHPDKML
ncbi:hypothetical protein [Laribacter hongkongensis]|nr:hypothetical protein [Laribacter hongkongensis]MCG9095411.1 hypothetical protein [Laribacter hongkongensis]